MTERPALNQNATSSTRGTIYQLFVAVQECFKMTESGQKVLIETRGDVTMCGETQVEVKHYSDDLTDSHPCFWKTLYNWMQDNFDDKPYKSLILFTTQKFSSNATIANWNDSDPNDRLSIIKKIYDSSEMRYSNKIKKTPNSPLPEVLRYQRFVFEKLRKGKLTRVLERFFIEAQSPKLSELYKQLKGGRLQSVLEGKRDDFLNALFGYITKPDKVNEKWDISYEGFCAKLIDLTEAYRKGTTIFPKVTISKIDNKQLEEHLFVKKIHDIDYKEVISVAIQDYLTAMQIINEEFKKYAVPITRTENYIMEIVRRFGTQHRLYSRKCSDIISDSKSFYDEIVLETPLSFEGFDMPPSIFRNGLLHSELNDEEKNLKWRLKKDE